MDNGQNGNREDLEKLLEQGAIEAVNALKRTLTTTDPRAQRDVVAAAKELLVAAQVGGYAKGAAGGNVTFLLGAEQVANLFGTMERVVGSMSVPGTAEEVTDVSAPPTKPKARRKRAPAKKAASTKRAKKSAKKPDLLSKTGSSGLSPTISAEAEGAGDEAGLAAV